MGLDATGQSPRSEVPRSCGESLFVSSGAQACSEAGIIAESVGARRRQIGGRCVPRMPRSPCPGTWSLSRRRRAKVREHSVSWAVIVPATVQFANMYHKGLEVNVDQVAQLCARHDRHVRRRTPRMREERKPLLRLAAPYLMHPMSSGQGGISSRQEC